MIKPDYFEAFNAIGNIFKEHGQLTKALEAFNRSLSIRPDFVEAINNIGNIFRDLNKIDKVTEAYLKAIKIDPNYPEVHRHLTTVKKYTRKDPHFLQVKSLYKNMDMGEEARCQLSFALAKMYEDIGELDKAFEFLSTGNDLRKKNTRL